MRGGGVDVEFETFESLYRLIQMEGQTNAARTGKSRCHWHNKTLAAKQQRQL